MKRRVRNWIAIAILVGGIGGLVFAVQAASPSSGNIGGDCCLNGYKSWKDPNAFSERNFVDCWCTYHKGRDMIHCSCGSHSTN